MEQNVPVGSHAVHVVEHPIQFWGKRKRQKANSEKAVKFVLEQKNLIGLCVGDCVTHHSSNISKTDKR